MPKVRGCQQTQQRSMHQLVYFQERTQVPACSFESTSVYWLLPYH